MHRKEQNLQLTEIYTRGKAFFEGKEFGHLLDYVETGFVSQNDRRILDRYTFRQRCIDAGEADAACHILGVKLATPVIMSSMTMPIPAIADDGLMQVAEGLKAAGSLMWTGTPIPANLNKLVETGVPLAANVKPLKDRTKMFAEIERILAAGVTWLGLEIDAGVGTKVADREMGFECQPLSSAEIGRIKETVTIPLIGKGILSREDARKCADAGLDAIVVSSHGGHTLDYLPHPFQVMDEIVDAVGDRMAVFVDGGFRRGSDVLKGLAFGASLVGLGRPILYGLAAGGKEAVTGLVEAITRELLRLMIMVGASRPDAVRRDILISD
jgi:isopentenyl diphosphate isomerase/L-lactate dehydrogenase-like FMN-dependent dehydrogenase